MAFGERSNDPIYQWHLAHCLVCDDAILCSGSMDWSFPLCTCRWHSFILAATCNVAMGFCIGDNVWDGDPQGYFVVGVADAPFSTMKDVRKRSN